MKKYRRLTTAATIFFSLCLTGAYAQESASNIVEEISLPDVSTVISGGAPKVGKSAVPDYSEVLPVSAEIYDDQILPQLPDSINADADRQNADTINQTAKSKDVYVEGLAGGGFPGFYTGNFQVYRQSGNNPFKISFGHESSSGYVAKPLTGGFFDKATEIGVEKTFSTKTMKILLNCSYENNDNGLQSQVSNVSDVSQELLGVGAKLDWQLPHGMALEFGLTGDWYNRYETVTSDADSVDGFIKDIGTLDLNPDMGFSFNYKGFSTGLTAGYSLQSDLKNSLNAAGAVNRGQFIYNASWKNDIVKVFGNVGVVVGNQIGNNPVMIPFDAGVDLSFATSISARKITLGVSGGMKSAAPKISEVEKLYKFTAFEETPSEVSDWYGKLDFTLPVKDIFTVNVNGEFKASALGNGDYVPVYSGTDSQGNSSFNHGLYTYEKKDMLQLMTNMDFSARAGIFNISAEWKANWLDRPALKSPHHLGLNVSVQDRRARWGGDVNFGINLGGDDYIPQVGAGFFYRLAPSVRLAVSLEDVVKLFSGTDRIYAGNYVNRSGSATILVKFFF